MTHADDECPDAEALAALADDMLPASARREVEAHVADCHRCQAVMAAIAHAEPAGTAVDAHAAAFSWWKHRRALTWFATAAAASIAIAVWVAIPGQRAPQSVAPQREQPTAAATPAAVPAPPAAPVPDTTKAPVDRLRASKETVAPAAKAESDAKLADAAPAAPPAAIGFAATNAAGARAARVASAPAAAAPPLAIEVVSPDQRIRWRIGPGATVQYSADAGVTWMTQQTNATAILTAGSSPAAGVCWLVGTGGTVLRTTDGGRNWLRTPFPDMVDLNAVAGSTALAATVDAADGRRFSTTDGGQTWTAGP